MRNNLDSRFLHVSNHVRITCLSNRRISYNKYFRVRIYVCSKISIHTTLYYTIRYAAASGIQIYSLQYIVLNALIL